MTITGAAVHPYINAHMDGSVCYYIHTWHAFSESIFVSKRKTPPLLEENVHYKGKR